MSKVTVIIPCYNGERTLDRCFKSVLSQTYQNLEILFINDGSTDNTLSIALRYAAADKRIRILDQKENKGVSAARNLGIEKATGDLIQFMDADDEMLPNMIETLYDVMKEEKADIAVCNFTGNPMFYTKFKDRVYDLHNENDLLKYYQDTFCMLLPWNKLYKRKVLTTKFDEKIHFAEDELFNLAVLRDARRIVCIDKPLYIYHYAPAEEDMDMVEEKSCLNKIIDSSAENIKNSIWYMGRELLPRRKKILERRLRGNLISNIDDYLYTRVFDFYFWELSAYAFMKTDKECIIRETIQVFEENEFKRSMAVQEKYGIHFIQYKGEKLELLVRMFIEFCLECYEDIMENELSINAYEIFLLHFLRIFCKEGPRKSAQYNKLSELKQDVINHATKEAAYYDAFYEERSLMREEVVV
ncbi:MAG: glycosyltransferase family 2 protein [Lachnospiraceae bacterium]|nr:glycosyltransferase family 2 protein [Lachnospiraceae bacterium]